MSQKKHFYFEVLSLEHCYKQKIVDNLNAIMIRLTYVLIFVVLTTAELILA